jgi:RimJ/RimL family protein N-acetyltransferase
MPFPDEFLTARLRAERLRAEHAPEIGRMHQDAAQMSFIGGVRDEVQTATYMTRSLAQWDAHGFGVWLLRDRATDAVAGRVLLRVMPLDGIDEVEVGYSFYASYWGRGLAAEAAAACMALGRAHFGFTGFVAVTAPNHVTSQRVLEKVGLALDRVIERDGVPLALFRSR